MAEGEKLGQCFMTGTIMQMHLPFNHMSDPLTSMGNNFHTSEIFCKKIILTEWVCLILSPKAHY